MFPLVVYISRFSYLQARLPCQRVGEAPYMFLIFLPLFWTLLRLTPTHSPPQLYETYWLYAGAWNNEDCAISIGFFHHIQAIKSMYYSDQLK
jgi:hypothetical protein